MGKLRSRDLSGWHSSITEERKADLEPVPFDYWFDCQSLDQQPGAHLSKFWFHSGQFPAWNCFLHCISWGVSLCVTPTATALSQVPSTTFTGSENIYPLPARSSQLISQGFTLAFPHLSYLLQIYQQNNINKPPPKCNIRHILWLFTLFQALFWILRMKNYKIYRSRSSQSIFFKPQRF